jgi:hypothetical protein
VPPITASPFAHVKPVPEGVHKEASVEESKAEASEESPRKTAGFVFHYPAQVPVDHGDPDCRELQAEGSSSVSDSSGVDGEGVMDYPSGHC